VLKTQIVPATAEQLARAGELIRRGALVAFPTETVYGLGACGLCPNAVQKIFDAKGRPADNPLILHVANMSAAQQLTLDWPPAALQAAKAFWPGPLTVILPKSAAVPDIVTAGLPNVAVRVPANPIALALIRAAGCPIAAPSANRSGRPSPTTAAHVYEDLAGRVALILDENLGGQGVSTLGEDLSEQGVSTLDKNVKMGAQNAASLAAHGVAIGKSVPVSYGLESTVVDFSGPVPTILRPGGITHEMLCHLLGHVEISPAVLAQTHGPVASPGMKYTHYAPRARVILLDTDAPALVARVRAAANAVALVSRMDAPLHQLCQQAGVAHLCMDEADLPDTQSAQGNANVTDGSGTQGNANAPGTPTDPVNPPYAKLFQALRQADAQGYQTIFALLPPAVGMGLAARNRLLRAAGFVVNK